MSGTILIDNDVITKELPSLEKLIRPKPESNNFMTGVVIQIPLKLIKTLDSLPGEEKLEVLDKPSSLEKISGVCHIRYGRAEPHEDICEIAERKNVPIAKILSAVEQYLPKNTIAWDNCEIKMTEGMKLLNAGFGNPYISNRSPMNVSLGGDKLCMFAGGVKGPKTTVSELKSIVRSYKSGKSCSMKVRIPSQSIKKLKDILEQGDRDGAEIAGGLELNWSDKDGEYIISIDEENMQGGSDEEVDVIDSRQNFHTHPAYAYKNHNVKVGWPSSQDYIGYVMAHKKFSTIFHIVCSLEGLYIIALTNHWFKNLDKTGRDFMKFVQKEFDISKKSGLTIPQYIRKVNAINYKGHRVFDVKFLDWKSAGKTFSVIYPKTDHNCFKNENTFRFVQKYH